MSRCAWIGRASADAAPWRAALEEAGYEVRALPLIRTRELELDAAGEEVLDGLLGFGWVFFASARGVELFGRRLAERRQGRPVAWPPALRAAAVGPVTASALTALGAEAELVGAGGGAELAARFLALDVDPDLPLLLVAARGGRPELRRDLEAAGHPVAVLELYESVAADGPAPAPGEPVLLFSPSGARSLAERVDRPADHPVWAVGPTTAGEARERGFPVAATLSRPDPAALRELLAR
jgi:uroporphyrinogen-III synthase